MACYFCHCMSLHVCPGEMFTLDSRLAFFWERNCPSGSLLVVLPFRPRHPLERRTHFKCVLLSNGCLGRKGLHSSIES